MSDCGGACCVVFPLSMPYARLRDRWPWITDADVILDMIEPIDLVAAIERSIDLNAPAFHTRPGTELFTCRHWDTTSRLCRIYDQRPAMCSGYPYGHACDHGCDCSHDYPNREPSPCPSPSPAPAVPATC